MGNSEASELLLKKAAEAVRAVDPAAFPVPAHVVRRVIRSERDISRLGMQVPHRKSYVINADELLLLVERDELGIELVSEVPSPSILIAQPGDETLTGLTLDQLLVRYWMLLFHARIDVTLAKKVETGELSPALIRKRIDQLGQVEFDEMHAVLREEDFLLPPEDFSSVYIEAAAVYLQLRYFEPRRLGSFFPALKDYNRVDAVFSQDLDVLYLLETTRPVGAPAPAGLRKGEDAEPKTKRSANTTTPQAVESLEEEAASSRAEYMDLAFPNKKVFQRLLQKANHVSGQGNAVRAALLRLKAAKYAAVGQSGETSIAAMGEIEQLAKRLQAALGISDEKADLWRDVMVSLLAKSAHGFWSADKRLLYDLQKVCVDHEREISTIDLAGWFTSFGRQPVRRLLPNQREVRINKHIRRATARLTSIRLSGPEREQLNQLLHEAAHGVEVQLRDRLRPLISEALDEVGFEPSNLPERVSRRKIVEEMLDKVVHHGFLNMSMLRDAISRNNLKMHDLSGPKELVRGDWLLQADKRLKKKLDGVYRRGEFYLRWLQRFSSVAFGTPAGRFATIYVGVPFGGAMIVLEGLKHMFDKIYGVEHPHADEPLSQAARDADAAEAAAAATTAEQPTHILSWFNITDPGPFILGIVILGAFLCAMIHVPKFRQAVFELFKSGFMAVRRLVYDLPRWFWKHEFLRKIFRSRAMRWFRRHVLYPLVFTFLVWLILPQMGLYERPEPLWGGAIFIVFAIALNSRAGRDIEELTTERMYQVWDHVRVKWFIALFETVVNFFQRVLETFERFMYAVDELLRFRSGQNILTLAVKAVLGLIWSAVAFVVRIYVTLLIEPQVNPIKHFPVVTVSHKFILPFSIVLTKIFAVPLIPILGTELGYLIAGSTVFLLPGIFGFLVWEFKENWKLYGANRKDVLKPVLVGSHGESMIRLMKAGFHSGTIPKLFKKLRRVDRNRRPSRRRRLRSRYEEKLYHTIEEVQHFVERELLVLLEESHQFSNKKVRLQNIQVASNSIRIALECEEYSAGPLVLAFQEQSGWLMVGVLEPGWLMELKDWHRRTLELAIAGFYAIAGVDIVREQLRGCFAPGLPPYDVTDKGLSIWPDGRFEAEVHYDLYARPWMRPRRRSLARQYDLPTLEANHALYCELPIPWDRWVSCWEAEESLVPMPSLFPHEVNVLPSKYLVPASSIR